VYYDKLYLHQLIEKPLIGSSSVSANQAAEGPLLRCQPGRPSVEAFCRETKCPEERRNHFLLSEMHHGKHVLIASSSQHWGAELTGLPLGGPRVSRITMAWTTRMCMVAVSPVVQRRNTWSWDSDWEKKRLSNTILIFFYQLKLGFIENCRLHFGCSLKTDFFQTCFFFWIKRFFWIARSFQGMWSLLLILKILILRRTGESIRN